MNESFEVPAIDLERETKIQETIQAWKELVAESDIEDDTKEQVRVLVEETGDLLGKDNSGAQWDRISEKMQTISSTEQILKKPKSENLKPLIDELLIDMARKHRELLQQ